MGCPSEVEIGGNLVFSVTTHDPDTGVLTDADAVPTYRVYEEETESAILTGTMSKLDDTNTIGFYTELIACTGTPGNGFENGKSYTIYIEATVDGDKGGICYGFRAVDTYAKIAEILSDTGTDGVVLADGAITDLKFSAGAINAAAIAASAVGSEELSPTATAAIADKYLGRSIAGGSDGGRTVTSALRLLRNKRGIASGTLTVYTEDDITPAWTAATSAATGNPITTIDPS